MRGIKKNILLGAAIAVTLAAAFVSGYITLQNSEESVGAAKELLESAVERGEELTEAEEKFVDSAISRHNRALKKFPLNIIGMACGIGPVLERAAAAGKAGRE